jgi:hypothetical protein
MNSTVIAMHNNAKIQQLLARIVVAVGLMTSLGLILGGCSSTSSGDGAARLLVAPDKFQNYTCEQLTIRANGTAGRRKQLEQLMAKAGTSFDGRVASALAYQSEYTETGGDLAELRRTATEKNCKPIASLQMAGPGR